MATENNDLGQSAEMIKAGLRRSGAASTASSSGSATAYYGNSRGVAEDMIREGLRASPPTMRVGPLDNNDERAAEISRTLMQSSEEPIAHAKPYEKPTDAGRSGEDYIRDGLRAERARAAAAARARADAAPKVRRTWR